MDENKRQASREQRHIFNFLPQLINRAICLVLWWLMIEVEAGLVMHDGRQIGGRDSEICCGGAKVQKN